MEIVFTLVTWILYLIGALLVITSMGALSEWSGRHHKATRLAIGMAEDFDHPIASRRSSKEHNALDDDFEGEDDEEDSLSDVSNDGPGPASIADKVGEPIAADAPTTSAPSNEEKTPGASTAVLQASPSPSGAVTNDVNGLDKDCQSVFQALVMLGSRSNHYPASALHDLVNVEARSASIESFEADILHSLIDKSSTKDRVSSSVDLNGLMASANRMNSPSPKTYIIDEFGDIDPLIEDLTMKEEVAEDTLLELPVQEPYGSLHESLQRLVTANVGIEGEFLEKARRDRSDAFLKVCPDPKSSKTSNRIMMGVMAAIDADIDSQWRGTNN